MKRFIIPLLAIAISFGSFAYAAFPPQTVSQGGTGWGAVQTGALLYGDTAFRLATTTQGTGGYVLSWSGGIPAWVATSSIQNIILTTTGSSGAATLNGMTLNIPQYTGGGSGTVSTSTNETAGYLPYWTSTNATPALLGKVATTSITFSGFPANIPSGYGKLVGGSDTTFTYWGLATTSQPASSNLLTSNGAAGVYGTATSTLSASSPLTGSFTQVGSGGSLGCTTASAGVAGCLNSTDWSTFNGKQAALSTPTWPIQLSGTTFSFGWATTSQPSSSNLWVSNGSNGFYGVGTSTLSLGTGFSYSGTLGSLVGGASGTLTVATSSLYSGTTGQFPYFSGTNALTATSSIFLATSGNVGIGTTSPYRTLSVSGSGVFTGGDVLASTFTATSSITAASLSLTTALSVSSGGTGQTTFTSSQLLYGNSTAALSSVATSSLSVGTSITSSGTLGSQIGGTASSLSLNMANANNWTGLQTFTNASSTQFTAGTNTLYIDSAGHIQGKDTTNGWSGVISPTHSFVLSVATTTEWTASTTSSGYSPFLVMPFTGTLQDVRCIINATSTTAGLGVNTQVNGSNATPSYFVASSTAGRIAFTAGNTFSVGQKILTNFGTTTISDAQGIACTYDVTETP